VNTSQWYRNFASEARAESPAYECVAAAVADDDEILRRLDQLPEPKRQPNLLFAATRYLAGPLEPPAAFRGWALQNWAELAATMAARSTQTNEPARCASLLPVLSTLPQPLALLEVGASAGLCLYPDAYQYRYDGRAVGPPDSPVRIDCVTSGGVPVPAHVPEVIWRAGIDLNPLDVADDGDLRWLESLIWPEQDDRVARLHAAAGILRTDPPVIRRGDVLAELAALAAEAPVGATLVVFHSAVFPYVPGDVRTAFADAVRSSRATWVANEAPSRIPGLDPTTVAAHPDEQFLLCRDGRPLARADPHAAWISWL